MGSQHIQQRLVSNLFYFIFRNPDACLQAWVESQYTHGAPGTQDMNGSYCLPANMSGYGLGIQQEEIRLQVPQINNNVFEKSREY